MKKFNLNLLLLFWFIAAGLQVNAQSLEQDLDAIFEAEYPEGQPGAAVLIAKDGKVIYRKAFGSADLELDVPMKPENVLEIGSITKQFTAVAILMLVEEGKLTLQDPLSKYIPDYPNGEKITVHHLLNHTSGIPNHIGMPDLPPKALDITPLETIAVFKNKPLDFEPGEKWKYSNAGYVLLGYIIEEAAKMTYEDFIETKIFQVLGMENSQYGSKKEIIHNRAKGYRQGPSGNGLENSPFLSMTVPYAGGSLMSTVDDMLLWKQAFHNNTLISEKNKQLVFKNTTLPDGTKTNYGYAWEIRNLYGSLSHEHGGGTLGYVSEGIYLPVENIYAIVLTNKGGNSATGVTVDAIARVMEKPISTSDSAISLPEETLKQWTGSYKFEDGTLRLITYKDGSLYSQREGTEENFQLLPISENEYRFKNSLITYTFGKEKDKKVVVFSSRTGVSTGEETKAPAERKSIVVDQAILDSYIGVYEGNPGPVITVTTKDGRIFTQPNGQPPVEIFAETPEVFFPKAFPGTITFIKDAQGNIKSLTLERGTKKMEAFKVK